MLAAESFGGSQGDMGCWGMDSMICFGCQLEICLSWCCVVCFSHVYTCAFSQVSNINSPNSHRYVLARSLCWLSFWWPGPRFLWMRRLRTSAHTFKGVEAWVKKETFYSLGKYFLYTNKSLKHYIQDNCYRIYVCVSSPNHTKHLLKHPGSTQFGLGRVLCRPSRGHQDVQIWWP